MNWTQDTPTEMGAYWHCATETGRPIPRELIKHPLHTSLVVMGEGRGLNPRTVEEVGGWWMGPIERPSSPKPRPDKI